MLGTDSHTQIHNIFCCDLFIIKYFQGHGKQDVTQISIYNFSKL